MRARLTVGLLPLGLLLSDAAATPAAGQPADPFQSARPPVASAPRPAARPSGPRPAPPLDRAPEAPATLPNGPLPLHATGVPLQPRVQPPSQPPPPQPVTPSSQPGQATSFGEENSDFGVQPQPTLKRDVGNPTPTSIPGAGTVLTAQLASELRQNQRTILIDALKDSHSQTIAGAVHLPSAGNYGTFADSVQYQLANDLLALTRGRREAPLVFFCRGVRCWESYNAVLRARAAGFPNVYWYRGGLNAWQAAGLPMAPLGSR